MNRQKESCTNCIHYSLNGFRPWCKECNKPINQGEVPPCNVVNSNPNPFVRQERVAVDYSRYPLTYKVAMRVRPEQPWYRMSNTL